MKTFKMNPARIAVVAVLLAMSLALVSWDFQKSPYYEKVENNNDTVPTGKKRDSKVRNLDEAIEELETLDLGREIENALAEAGKALKEVDMSRIQAEIEKSLKEIDLEKLKMETEASLAKVDMAKIEKEIAEAMEDAREEMQKAQVEMEKAFRSIDMSKIQEEVKRSLNSVDWEQIKKEMESAKNIDLSVAEKEIRQAQEELKKMGPEIRKSLEDAKVEIEKAKVELKLYKELVDGLHKDGLLNKDEEYTVDHEDGKLIVNGKQVSDAVYNKYKKVLDKKKQFRIQKSENGINIDHDDKNKN